MRSIRLRKGIFKSIQWKLVVLYLLLVMFIMSIISVFLLQTVEDLYYSNFNVGMKNGFNATRFSQGKIDAASLDDLKARVSFYSGMFLIDGLVRNIYILDNFGTVLYSSDSLDNEQIGKKQFTTVNVRKAILEQVGDTISEKSEVLDFAQPVVITTGENFIIYITDNKSELKEMLDKLKGAIMLSIVGSLIIAAIIGFLFARTITIPIKDLARKARKMAQGHFDQRIKETSDDEIGQLTKDFNHMAFELNNTLNEISNEKSKVETILKHMTDGVMAFDKEGRIIHINPAAERILRKDISDKTFDQVFSSIGMNLSIEEFVFLNDDLARERTIELEDTFIKLFFISFKNEKEELGGVIVILQDITEIQKLDNMRREFVANVSHELRTPLTTIKSYVETLMDGAIEDEETAKEFFGVIDAETDRMTRLVKDLLELSRLESQKIVLKIEDVNLDTLIKSILKRLNIEIKNKNQTVEYFIISNVPDTVKADKDKIEQVLLNIVGNANKYTQNSGKISIYYGAMFDKVYIKVVDNGIGIPEKDLTRVFERFYRVDKARSRKLGGTGLGLAISKEIVELHGGNISISSEVGKGTEVVLYLPIKIQEI